MSDLFVKLGITAAASTLVFSIIGWATRSSEPIRVFEEIPISQFLNLSISSASEVVLTSTEVFTDLGDKVVFDSLTRKFSNVRFKRNEPKVNWIEGAITLGFLGFSSWMMWKMLRKMGGQDEERPQPLSRDPRGRLTFNDVAGHEQTKEELNQIVSIFKNPEILRDIGARAPRGVLLEGPSGTGKTLLARATAGEAGVPFFYASASSFVEVYVGKGAQRVRSLFEEARANAPCILFIDELDAIGTARSSGNNLEHNQTINQLLTEMDGVETAEASGGDIEGHVVVMAATNKYDLLDPALLRPGRFDKIFEVGLPDRHARLQAFLLHARGKTVDPRVNFQLLSEDMSEGLVGADIESIMNEAALAAAREGSKVISGPHILNAVVKARKLNKERNSTEQKEMDHMMDAMKLMMKLGAGNMNASG